MQYQYNITTDGDIADQIGDLRAEIKKLRDAEEFLVDLLKEKHIETAIGERYRVAVTYGAERKVVAWKAIAEKLQPSYQLVTANTSVSVYDRVNVSAQSKH